MKPCLTVLLFLLYKNTVSLFRFKVFKVILRDISIFWKHNSKLKLAWTLTYSSRCSQADCYKIITYWPIGFENSPSLWCKEVKVNPFLCIMSAVTKSQFRSFFSLEVWGFVRRNLDAIWRPTTYCELNRSMVRIRCGRLNHALDREKSDC